MTLTVPHAHELGKDTSGCVRQLLEAFSETRGSNGDRRQQKWWNNHITGGIYAVEILPPAANRKDFLDTSLHVHIHCLLLAEQDLSRDVGSSHSSFTQQLRDEWARRTGANERGVCLEPIYWKEGKIKHEYVHGLGHGSAQFIRAVNGAVGYITKGTAPELFQTLTARELYAVHVTHKRTYGRFGVLYGRNAHQQFTHTELLEVDPKPKRAKHQLSEPNYTAPSTSSAKPELNVPVVAQFESCACQHIHVDKPLGDQCLSNALEPSSSPVIWTDADWDSVFG
ncbi:hypothetical protein AUC43_17240 [Hymenobacter sedentarius]|uniref:Uncharacterized protein n=1 Tax=Hymenobacter sedentarius TaxID=1411621 RepID=A0A0U3K260_9BACT|nr:hypothetical protein AUC43_17240 [Hymenobacter sedentarius]